MAESFTIVMPCPIFAVRLSPSPHTLTTLRLRAIKSRLFGSLSYETTLRKFFMNEREIFSVAFIECLLSSLLLSSGGESLLNRKR